MADTKVSALTAADDVDDADLFHLVKAGVDKKATAAQMRAPLAPSGDDGDLQAKSGSGFASAGTPAEMLAALGVPVSIVVDLDADDLRNGESVPPVLVANADATKILRIVSLDLFAPETSIPFNQLGFDVIYDGLTDEPLLAAAPEITFYTGQHEVFIMAQASADANDLYLDDIAGKDLVAYGLSDVDEGAMLTVIPNDGGADFEVGDTVAPDNFPGDPVLTVAAETGGVVTALTVTSGGFGFSAGATALVCNALTGIGSGLTIDVSTITPANGTLRVWVTYQIRDLPA